MNGSHHQPLANRAHTLRPVLLAGIVKGSFTRAIG